MEKFDEIFLKFRRILLAVFLNSSMSIFHVVFILETKGREDLNDIRKIQRLKTWCEDVNNLQSEINYIPIYIKQENWDKYREDIRKFADVKKLFELENLEK